MDDLIKRQDAIDAIERSGLTDDPCDTEIRIIEVLPSAQLSAKDMNVLSNGDLISRQDAVEELRGYITKPNISDDESEIKGYNDGLNMAITVISTMPSAQKTGQWIHKSRGEQKNSECSECHTLFRVLIHDYPYCPVCGSRNRGEEE